MAGEIWGWQVEVLSVNRSAVYEAAWDTGRRPLLPSVACLNPLCVSTGYAWTCGLSWLQWPSRQCGE